MKTIFLVLLICLMQSNVQAQEMDIIEHHLFCGMLTYQTLKAGLTTKSISFQQEIDHVDKIGAYLGKARQLTLEKHGSNSGHYEIYRNKAIKALNSEMERINSLPSKEQEIAGYKIGENCGRLYARTLYTKEDLGKSQKGLNKMKDLFKQR